MVTIEHDILKGEVCIRVKVWAVRQVCENEMWLKSINERVLEMIEEQKRYDQKGNRSDMGGELDKLIEANL